MYRVSSLLSTEGKYCKACAVLFLHQYLRSEGKEFVCDADIFCPDIRLLFLLHCSWIGFTTIPSI